MTQQALQSTRLHREVQSVSASSHRPGQGHTNSLKAVHVCWYLCLDIYVCAHVAQAYAIKQLLTPHKWVCDTFGGAVSHIIYIDDNLEVTEMENVQTVELPCEGHGLKAKHFEQILAKLDHAGQEPGQVLFVFDFDCTISMYHMFKAMHMESSSWRRKWERHTESNHKSFLPPISSSNKERRERPSGGRRAAKRLCAI